MSSAIRHAVSRRPRIAHCVGFYFPEQVGGTEVYVQDLCVELARRSVDGYVIAATDGSRDEYFQEGVPVLRYPSHWAEVADDARLGAKTGLSKFQALVLENRPDIFHLHSWTTGAGLTHLSQVAQLGIPCLVTMHVPSPLCMRGTMLLHGRQACDGRIDEKRCVQCWAEARGLPATLAYGVSLLPRALGDRLASRGSSRAMTLLSARSLARTKAHELHLMAGLCEKIVAPSQWVADALAANGIAADKFTISRQAVSPLLAKAAAGRSRREPTKELMVGFVGRLEPYKGAHVLVEAMAGIPRDVPIRLLLAGKGPDAEYVRRLADASDNDRRIEFCGPISREELPGFLSQLDILAVPSKYMETGPLVVLEGYALGLPVMGADLGGISERIRDGVDGWLLPFDDSGAWAATMQRLALDRNEIDRMTANIEPSRTMEVVASEMIDLYSGILRARLLSAKASQLS